MGRNSATPEGPPEGFVRRSRWASGVKCILHEHVISRADSKESMRVVVPDELVCGPGLTKWEA